MQSLPVRIVGRVALVILGGLVGLLLAEGIARHRTLDPGAPMLFGAMRAIPHALFEWDQQLGVLPTPNFTTHIETVDFSVDIRTDSHGLRGPEPGEGPHWLFLGDSFVMALQVDEPDTVSGLLAQRTGMSVLNGGVDGASGWLEALRYERLASDLDIDRVTVVVFLGNDVMDNQQFLDQHGGDPDGPFQTGAPTFPGEGSVVDAMPAWQRFLFRHSVIYAMVDVAKARATMEAGNSPSLAQARDENRLFLAPPMGTDPGQAAEILMRPLRRLAQATAQRQAELLVVVAVPYFVMDEEVARDSMELYGLGGHPLALDAVSQALLSGLEAEGIAACDLTGPLRQSWQRGDQPYLRFDGHWSPAGHQVAADAIAECLGL